MRRNVKYATTVRLLGLMILAGILVIQAAPAPGR